MSIRRILNAVLHPTDAKISVHSGAAYDGKPSPELTPEKQWTAHEWRLSAGLQFSRLRWAIVLIFFLAGLGRPVLGQPGWPRGGAEGEWIQASPALYDFDGDGKMEIVTVSSTNQLFVYAHDGTLYDDDFPVTLGFGDGTISSPAIGDVDGDGQVEIVIAGDDENSSNGRIEVYEADGSLCSALNLANGSLASVKGTPCLIDCYRYANTTRHSALEIILRDGDGQMHFVYWNGSALADRYNTYNSVYQTLTTDTLKDRSCSQPFAPSVAATLISTDTTRVVMGSTDGTICRWTIVSTAPYSSNWLITKLSPISLTTEGARFYSSPLLIDVDGDGDRDIFIGDSQGVMYALDGDSTGTELSGDWPAVATQGFMASAGGADLDQDGHPDIFVGSNDGGVYAWSRTGAFVSAWPSLTGGDVFGSPVAAELDGQPGLEIAAGSLDGWLYLWHADGSPVEYWPKRLNTPLYATPAIGDLHGSGRASIVAAGYDGRIFVFDLDQKYGAGADGWKQFRGNAARTGVH